MDKMEQIIKALQDKKDKQKAVKYKYADKKKVKALTQTERIARLEEYLGLDSE